jgi:hypothetical protein
MTCSSASSSASLEPMPSRLLYPSCPRNQVGLDAVATNDHYGRYSTGSSPRHPHRTFQPKSAECASSCLALRISANLGVMQAFFWTWNDGRILKLYWALHEHVSTVRTIVSSATCLILHLQCYLIPADANFFNPVPGRDTPLAVFSGRPLKPREDRQPHPPATLKVFPSAHTARILDHVVIGALVFERRRLAPAPWLVSRDVPIVWA